MCFRAESEEGEGLDKRLFYWLYALAFHLFRLFPIRNNRVVLVSPHNADFTDSLGAIEGELILRGGYDIRGITRRDLTLQKDTTQEFFQSLLRAAWYFTGKAYFLATARYIFLNDNYMPMAYLHFSKKATVVQLWHAEGAFKRFGLAAPLDTDSRDRLQRCGQRLNYVVCSSQAVVPIYAEAFGVQESQVLPLGSPRTDTLVTGLGSAASRAKLEEADPALRGKKLVLYAPTFRDDPVQDQAILQHFDVAAFQARFGKTHHLLVRLHPQVHANVVLPEGCSDLTAYADVSDLVRAADILITDYSSICMDFALLQKPCVFYAYDLEAYIQERAFYFPYLDYVPGPVATDFTQLLLALENPELSQRAQAFCDYNFDKADGRATARVLQKILQES